MPFILLNVFIPITDVNIKAEANTNLSKHVITIVLIKNLHNQPVRRQIGKLKACTHFELKCVIISKYLAIQKINNKSLSNLLIFTVKRHKAILGKTPYELSEGYF
ncbi:hypothetical protein A9G25_07215 [Gilliamella sp. Bif1-4]|jgi:transcriptional regulator of met regulon|nr:hypothetical protein A9G25_07215 [Gilliamella apicola]